jgi:hypothetical protein
MPRHYCSHVEITAHAHSKWRLRAPGQDELSPGMIMGRLNNILRLGVQPDAEGAVWVPVTKILSAVCTPELDGCWRVITYKYHGEWSIYEREAAR